ncbi:MAG: class C beta-lactamase-related serine hydrolase [Calditrichaeota bacterium]|nr:MAG: class C beta-lactamase-related serine hydrolase [Calditrichota bacterium]
METNCRKKCIFFFLAHILLFSCSDDKPTSPDLSYPGLPEELNDGWQVAPMQLKGMDEEIILTLSDRVENGDYGQVHSMTIACGNHLIFDQYYLDHSSSELHRTYSVTKSVVSTLVGIAIEKGFIASVDEKISTYLAQIDQYEIVFQADTGKKQLTIDHLLTMSAGLEWNELAIPYSNSNNDWNQMTISDDYIRYSLQKPFVAAPGTQFNYNSGCTVILGKILHLATGKHIDVLSAEWLFEPLGIVDYNWRTIAVHDMPHAASGLDLRPRDMAKIGKLFLDGGIWEGEQIIPAAWAEDATAPHIPAWYETSYGYQWWMVRYTRIPQPGVNETQYLKYAMGYAGQLIILVPVNGLVVVLTGGNGENMTDFEDMVFNYILEAVVL